MTHQRQLCPKDKYYLEIPILASRWTFLRSLAPHPLLVAQGSLDTANNRTQRMTRSRRYQYLQEPNTRHSNPPVILQRLERLFFSVEISVFRTCHSNSHFEQFRLLGPGAQRIPLSGSQILTRSQVVVMDNGLGIRAFNNEEEQIDFVDPCDYLYGPSLAATLNTHTERKEKQKEARVASKEAAGKNEEAKTSTSNSVPESKLD